MQEKLSSLGNRNPVEPISSSPAISLASQGTAELIISGIPDPVVNKLPPTDISAAIFNYLQLPQLTSDVLNIRKFDSKVKQNVSNARNRDAPSFHSYLVYMKSSQVRDFIVDSKRKIKLLPAEDIFSGIIDDNYGGSIYINEFLHPETYKLLLKTKEKAKTMNFKYVWVGSGHIFAKKDDNSDRLSITSTVDLSKLEGRQNCSINNSINKSSSPLNVLSLNINSLVGHMAQFLNLVHETHPDIIILTETWLKPSLDNQIFSLSEYTVVRRDRTLKHSEDGRYVRGGGVACLIHNSLKAKVLHISASDHITSLNS